MKGLHNLQLNKLRPMVKPLRIYLVTDLDINIYIYIYIYIYEWLYVIVYVYMKNQIGLGLLRLNSLVLSCYI